MPSLFDRGHVLIDSIFAGLIDLDLLRASIRPDTGLVSVMAINNEIGVYQPLEEIGEICRENKIFFHTDAAQVLRNSRAGVAGIAVHINILNTDTNVHYIQRTVGCGEDTNGCQRHEDRHHVH